VAARRAAPAWPRRRASAPSRPRAVRASCTADAFRAGDRFADRVAVRFAAMLATLLLAAEEASEPSKVPFEIAAAVLVAWALVLAFVGIRQHATFPPSTGAQRGLMLLTVLLVAATMFTAVITG
jgi:hypothetical protein